MKSESKLKLPNPGKNPWTRMTFHCVNPVVSRFLALNKLQHCYEKALQDHSQRAFGAKVLSALNVDVSVIGDGLDQVPTEGPLIVVANHPFGGIEAMILDALFEKVRPDMKYIANFILEAIPEYRERFFPVDPFGGKGAVRRNLSGVRQAINWVKKGHALTIFPAGEVSHLHMKKRCVMDGPWLSMAARIVQTTRCPVLPICFIGRNSNMFQLMGLIHPRVRTLLLIREFLKKKNSTISVKIGSPVPAKKYERIDDPDKLTDYLRLRTSILDLPQASKTGDSSHEVLHEPLKLGEPVAPRQDVVLLTTCIDSLPEEQFLLKKEPLSVIVFDTKQAYPLVKEIGRLRELTFRAVGEGTGKSEDIDEYDSYYQHLIVWDHAEKEIVGAYRVGRIDEILDSYGVRGIYTSTLFKFDRRLMHDIKPALELGRSFVQPKYQRHFAPLMLLWKGIGAYVVKNPKYRHLMGPVSISRDYSDGSRYFIKKFLENNYFAKEYADRVKPRKPVKIVFNRQWSESTGDLATHTIEDVDTLIKDLEGNIQGAPVLLRQYLKLDAKLLGFNVDTDFGNVMDAMLLIDLTAVSRRTLNRYMGSEAAESFLDYNRAAKV